MTAPIYAVVDWGRYFEVNRTKELKQMTWVPIPNKQDGDGYTELLDHPDGAAHFGAWIAIVQVASKCTPRGTLLRDDRSNLRESRTFLRRPHDAASLSRITRIPVDVVQAALNRLVEIGWLAIALENQEIACISQQPAGIPHESAATSQGGAAIPQDDAASRADATEHGREWKGRTGQESTSSHAHARNRAEPAPEDNSADCLDQLKTALEAPDGYPAGHLGGLGGGLAQSLYTAWRAGWIRPDGTSPPNGAKSITCSEVLESLARWKLWWEKSESMIPYAKNWIERGSFLEPAPVWKPKTRQRDVDIRRSAGGADADYGPGGFDPERGYVT